MSTEALEGPGGGDDHRDYEASLQQEFIDMATDRLSVLDELLEQLRASASDSARALREIRQTAHNLKGMGGSFGFPIITTIAHRLENYLADLGDLDSQNQRDAQVYVDVMAAIVSSGHNPADSDAQTTVRGLPPKPGLPKSDFDVDGVEVSDVEVMLAIPSGTAAHYVTRQLQACGYRVITVKSPFEALEQAVRTRPDLLIVSAVMDGLTGMDLAAAVTAMASTKKLKVALLTSLDLNDRHLLELPDGIPLIRKGPEFGDDLADALETLGIT